MIAIVAGTRPNCVKVAPILRELDRRAIPRSFVWSGQHKGALDLRAELEMPPADVEFAHGPAAETLDRITTLLVQEWAARRPSVVVVVGDVTSTLAAALAASAHGIEVVHVEAWLRSGDWTMPEERNRVLVDRLSDLLLTSDRGSHRIARDACHVRQSPVFVGNVMIDSLRWANDQIERRGGAAFAPLKVSSRYGLVTVHRPSNVDTLGAWRRTKEAVYAIRGAGLDAVWVIHPRAPLQLDDSIPASAGRGELRVMLPVGYIEMTRLIGSAALVATDSGGVQEETTALGIPCLTLRDNTERPITVTEGTNTVVGLDPARIGEEVRKILGGAGKRGRIPEGWDGHAAERIVDAIAARYT